jgi:hypothetical protein
VKTFFQSLLLCWLCLITSCSVKPPKVTSEKSDPFHWKWVYKETERIRSSDNEVDAVVVTGDVGAIEATKTYIYIVPHDSKITDEGRNEFVFSGDYVKNLKVVWKETRFLEIHYDEARIFEFKNYWENQKVDNDHYHIEIKLLPQQDYSLPWDLLTW